MVQVLCPNTKCCRDGEIPFHLFFFVKISSHRNLNIKQFSIELGVTFEKYPNELLKGQIM